MTRQSTIFGGGGGGITPFGVWQPGVVIQTPGLLNEAETKRPDVSENRRMISGFLRNGDSLELGASPTITYRDDTGSTVWTAVPSDISALATAWGGFFIDTPGTLLYVLASQRLDLGSFNIFLATIDVAGTINNIATMVPATLVGSTLFDWQAALTGGRGEMFPIIGTDLAIAISQDTAVSYWTFNYLTGAIVTDTVRLADSLSTGNVIGLDKNNIVALTQTNGNQYGFFGVEGSPFGDALPYDTDAIPAVVRDAIGEVQTGNSNARFMTRLDADYLLALHKNLSAIAVSRVQTLDTLTTNNAAMLFQYMGANL